MSPTSHSFMLPCPLDVAFRHKFTPYNWKLLQCLGILKSKLIRSGNSFNKTRFFIESYPCIMSCISWSSTYLQNFQDFESQHCQIGSSTAVLIPERILGLLCAQFILYIQFHIFHPKTLFGFFF